MRKTKLQRFVDARLGCAVKRSGGGGSSALCRRKVSLRVSLKSDSKMTGLFSGRACNAVHVRCVVY